MKNRGCSTDVGVNQLPRGFAAVGSTNVGVDIYNIMNRAPILTYNQTFVLPNATNPNGSWLTPTSVLQPRFFKISAQIDF